MTILSVTPKSKTRYEIRTAEGESFMLGTRDLVDFGISKESPEEPVTVPEAVETEIRNMLRSRALMKCGDLLKSQDYTEARLREKLKDAGFPASIIALCVGEMKKAHYIDDFRYAESMFRTHLADRSVLKIRTDLSARGVRKETIDAAFEAVQEAAGGEEAVAEAELQKAVMFLSKKGYRYDPEDYAGQQKASAALYRKGFSQDVIREAVRRSGDADMV